MPFLPFILDRSSTAKLIKSIDAADRSQDKLKALNKIMMNDLQQVPYSYLIKCVDVRGLSFHWPMTMRNTRFSIPFI